MFTSRDQAGEGGTAERPPEGGPVGAGALNLDLVPWEGDAGKLRLAGGESKVRARVGRSGEEAGDVISC